jgi:hypothetical protein
MVVRDDNGGGVRHDAVDDLTRVDQDSIERAAAHLVR